MSIIRNTPTVTHAEVVYREVASGLTLLSPLVLALLVFGTDEFKAGAMAYFVCMAALLLARNRHLKQVKLILQRHDFRICPECRHILVGLENSGHCPACDRLYDHTALERLWRETYELFVDEERRVVLAEDLLKCGNCGYSIEGLPEQGVCPECGVPYSPEVFHVARSLSNPKP